MSFCCAPLRTGWFYLVYSPLVGRWNGQLNLTLTFSRLKKPVSLSLCLHIMCSSPLTIFTTLRWTPAFSFVNMCWLFLVMFLFFMFLEMASRDICYIIFIGLSWGWQPQPGLLLPGKALNWGQLGVGERKVRILKENLTVAETWPLFKRYESTCS